jgi:hypothetical protein
MASTQACTARKVHLSHRFFQTHGSDHCDTELLVVRNQSPCAICYIHYCVRHVPMSSVLQLHTEAKGRVPCEMQNRPEHGIPAGQNA